VLQLSDNNIGIAGISVLANALSKTGSLKTLMMNKGCAEDPTSVCDTVVDYLSYSFHCRLIDISLIRYNYVLSYIYMDIHSSSVHLLSAVP